MRLALCCLSAALVLGCGRKAPPEPVPVPESTPPAPLPVEEVEEVPVEYAPTAPVYNADLQLTVRRADGTAHAGHVRRIERSTDWYGEEDWTTSADDVRLVLEGNGTELRAPWSDLKSVTVTHGKVSESTDCTYDSNYTPWMYDCTLRTEAAAVTRDGRKWQVVSRQKWRFTFDDDTSEEFWLFKHPAREQDSQTVSLTDATGENYEMYEALQDRLRQEVQTLVTGITIQAP